MAKATWLDSGVDLNLLQALVEHTHAATVPANPNLVTDQFSGHFVKSARHFNVTIAMYVTACFLVGCKN